MDINIRLMYVPTLYENIDFNTKSRYQRPNLQENQNFHKMIFHMSLKAEQDQFLCKIESLYSQHLLSLLFPLKC